MRKRDYYNIVYQTAMLQVSFEAIDMGRLTWQATAV